MSVLWLNGGYWGPWVRRVFVSEIEWMRQSILEHVLPSFPDPSAEADKARDEAWNMAISQPSDGSLDESDFVEWAEGKGFETYLGITRMRQAAANLASAMLWHLLEQQMLMFLMRQILNIHEEQNVRENPEARSQLFRLNEFHRRLDEVGCSMKSLSSWPKVNELRLVANAVKHGPGESLDELFKIRPDLLSPPCLEKNNTQFYRYPAWVEKPAGGEDIYVSDADLTAYFIAAMSLWQEFGSAIEKHFTRKT